MKNINLKIFLSFCIVSMLFMAEANSQTKIKQVGPSANKNGNTEMLSFSMLGKGLAANDFVSLKKLRKAGASVILNYQIDNTKFKRLKPNDVSFKMTLLRAGTKLKINNWKHVEQKTSLDLAEMLSIAEPDDSLLIEVSGLPLKSTEKLRTIVFKK